MKRAFLLLCVVVALSGNSQALKKTTAVRVDIPPKIDGLLNDAAWQSAPEATGFIENNPDPGKPSAQKLSLIHI